MEFLNEVKTEFRERMNNRCIERIIAKPDNSFEIIRIKDYNEAKLISNETIDYHKHYCDWNKKLQSFPDIEIHTCFQMKEVEGEFIWDNTEVN